MKEHRFNVLLMCVVLASTATAGPVIDSDKSTNRPRESLSAVSQQLADADADADDDETGGIADFSLYEVGSGHATGDAKRIFRSGTPTGESWKVGSPLEEVDRQAADSSTVYEVSRPDPGLLSDPLKSAREPRGAESAIVEEKRPNILQQVPRGTWLNFIFGVVILVVILLRARS